MKNKHLYNVVISGLPAGVHTYPFELGDAFFAGFENSEVQHGQLQAEVSVEKQCDFLQLGVHITGSVTTPCDRCLDDLQLPVQFHATPVVKFTDSETAESLPGDDDILWATAGDHELDIAPYLYDSIILSLPLRRIHPDGQCNREMTERLKQMNSE
ncbi:MAG: DUF177 domain-containing protein [Prevotellaceae bacterium]|nr:DUF177 domain-containing protein [Prevotellaceae bacterium]